MTQAFDEAYARYLECLAQLDDTSDISAKNTLFRQLTEQLSEMEGRIKKQLDSLHRENPAPGEEQSE